jgi:hypothetical protein
LWARTNQGAQELLEALDVQEVSLDHDLGGHDVDPDSPGALYVKGTSPSGSGLDLVRWMCETGHVPPLVTIHSWNESGAHRMMLTFAQHGWACVIEPYQLPQTQPRSLRRRGLRLLLARDRTGKDAPAASPSILGTADDSGT